jgi:regulator of sigma E protease
MDNLVLAAQLILSLSILIILHEMGHFFPARWFNTRVEKFYLFFDWGFSLFKFKTKKIDENGVDQGTEYGIGWLPLGGYVKISGMVDESMDKEQMALPPQPWEFRSKPAWQRLIIMIGGVTVNLILGMFIYSMILFAWGKEYLSVENAKYGVVVGDSIVYDLGFRNGDKIVSVNGKMPKDFRDLNIDILLNEPNTVKVNRQGSIIDVKIPEGFAEKVVGLDEPTLFYPAIPAIVDSVMDDSPAATAKLMKGDTICGVNQHEIHFMAELSKELTDNKGKDVTISVVRGLDTLALKTKIGDDGKLGFFSIDPKKIFNFSTETFGFFESFPAGISEGATTLVNYVKQFKLVFTKEGSQKLGGFGAIASQFDKGWDWHRFWNITAFLSIVLAFMNILPIPALDGGHVMFLLYEIVTGRKPSDKFLERAQMIGMILLLSLLVFANGNDIYKWIKGLMK